MLRGPQTPGELRGTAARLHEFAGLDEIEQTLNALISRDPDPLVMRLPRQVGQKEVRFAPSAFGRGTCRSSREAAPRVSPREALEQKVERLAAEVESLRQQFEQFKKQFE